MKKHKGNERGEEGREEKRPFPPPSPAARRRRIPGERREVLRGVVVGLEINANIHTTSLLKN
jgi:hypothetical protein